MVLRKVAGKMGPSHKLRSGRRGPNRRAMPVDGRQTEAPAPEYKVGPGRPPKEFQFKPGQSGNPKGAKRKQPSLQTTLKTMMEEVFNRRIKLTQGDKEQMVTYWSAGLQQLAAQFAKGDRYARRDVFTYGQMLGVEFLTGPQEAAQQHLEPEAQQILDDYVARNAGSLTTAELKPTLAPAELLDDDLERSPDHDDE